MAKKTAQNIDDVFTLTKTMCIDLPLTGTQWVWGAGTEEAVTKTVWQGYDAGARLAAAAIDALYQTPLYGAVLNRVAPVLLRWQRVTNAINGALFASFWRTVGLPTTTETCALHEELSRLRSGLQAHRHETDALVGLVTRIVQALEKETPAPTASARLNGYVMGEKLFKPAALSMSRQQGN